MSFLHVILLGAAVSFDGFGVGFAFGARKVQIPLLSLLIICLFSSFSVYSSMLAGTLASGFFNPRTASSMGGSILILVGAFIARQALQNKREADIAQYNPGSKKSRLQLLSVVLRNPSLADSDNSGTISAQEAVLLGVTLAFDALGAGFGAAMMGFSTAATAVAVAMCKFVFVSAGLYLGRRFAEETGRENTAVFSGLILLFLGLIHLSRSLLSW